MTQALALILALTLTLDLALTLALALTLTLTLALTLTLTLALAPDGLEQRRAVCAPLRREVETAEDLAQQHAQLLLALVS